jgi:hypothetical protein
VRSAPTRLTTREGGDTTGAPERLENPGFTTGMGRYNYNGVKKDGRDQREPGERRSCLPSVVRVGCSDRSVERASRRGRTKEYMYVWYYGYRGSRGLRRGLVGLAGARPRPSSTEPTQAATAWAAGAARAARGVRSKLSPTNKITNTERDLRERATRTEGSSNTLLVVSVAGSACGTPPRKGGARGG